MIVYIVIKKLGFSEVVTGGMSGVQYSGYGGTGVLNTGIIRDTGRICA